MNLVNNSLIYTSLITGHQGIIEGLVQAAPRYDGPERRDTGTLGRRLSDIPETLLGCSLISAGQDAQRYLGALQKGETGRLEAMLRTAIQVGETWKERLTK